MRATYLVQREKQAQATRWLIVLMKTTQDRLAYVLLGILPYSPFVIIHRLWNTVVNPAIILLCPDSTQTKSPLYLSELIIMGTICTQRERRGSGTGVYTLAGVCSAPYGAPVFTRDYKGSFSNNMI